MAESNGRLFSNRNALLVALVVVSQSCMIWWTLWNFHRPQGSIGFDDISSFALQQQREKCEPTSLHSESIIRLVEKESNDDKSIVQANPIHAAGVDANATCNDLMNHFHTIQRAFFNGKNTPNTTVSPPLINYGFYKGQGFGRVVDHSMSHCLLSLALDRPCLVDLSDRDPFYTWRAFIDTSMWDLEYLDHTALTASVRTAIGQMTKQEDGEWQTPVPHTDNLHLMGKLTTWPKGRTDRKKYFKYIEPWRDEHIPKALLSPNWGSAWFPQLQPPAYFGQCHRKELMSRIQNSMYRPTHLSRKLFGMQRQHVLREPANRPYGAIHIRFVILQIQKMSMDDAVLAQKLEQCLRHAQRRTNLTEWWVISDKPARAIDVARNVSKDFRIYHLPEGQNTTGITDHSNNPKARGVFGHASMAVSVLDWMVLHESQAAIVTVGTSYGDTGARGRGKWMRDDLCGVFSLYVP